MIGEGHTRLYADVEVESTPLLFNLLCPEMALVRT
jgi:hypothetical protein